MSVYLTGDIHGDIDIHYLSNKNWKVEEELTKDDYLIILGDFGLFFRNPTDKTEKYWLEWLNNRPYTTLFIDGNHENFDILDSFPEKRGLFGPDSFIGVTPYDSIFHVKRGSVLELDNKTFFCFGGATSIDKESRLHHVSWWEREVPNFNETYRGLGSLDRYSNKVDFVLTHCLPSKKHLQLPEEILSYKEEDSVNKTLQQFDDILSYERWYCGHYHINIEADDFSVLYKRVIKI